jgi:hypothetical protein
LRCLPQQNRIKKLRTTVWGMSLKFSPAFVPEIRDSGYRVESLELNSTIFSNRTSRLEGRAVLRFPEQLRLHPALGNLVWTGAIAEFNGAALPKNQSVPEPILITRDGTILAGMGRWRVALFEGRQEIHCIEYPLTEEESLEFILTYHQTRIGWNRFVCTRLALTLEHNLQQKALDNMRAGGKYKGSANLPDLQRIDVLQAISRVARVSPRTVGNVKVILKTAHPRLIAALQNDMLTIESEGNATTWIGCNTAQPTSAHDCPCRPKLR